MSSPELLSLIGAARTPAPIAEPAPPAAAFPHNTAETIFERNLALALLGEVFQQLQREHHSVGKGELFEQLKFCLTGERSSVPYAELSANLNLSETALKVTVHRLRKRYREILFAEIADTLSEPTASAIKEEMQAMFAALA